MYHTNRNFSMTVDALYRIGVYNYVNVTTPCVSDSCEKIKLEYSSGLRVRIPFECYYRVDRRVGINTTLAPFFDWNKFADTHEKNSQNIALQIPTNTRWYLGIMANFGIAF